MVATVVNRFDSSFKDERTRPWDPNTPAPNVHGDKLFLIKLQLAEEENGDNFLIYDRQRTSEAFFLEKTDPAGFQKLREEVQGPRGGYHGRKMYRWAKRVSDWELSLCLDKEPREKIAW